MNRRHNKAFTLVELLTVIAIIVLLAAILLPTVGGAIRSARMAKVQARLHDLASGCEHYKMDNGYYPGQQYAGQLTGSSGRFTGSQMLALCLMPPQAGAAAAAAETWNGTDTGNAAADPAQRFGSYVDYKYTTDKYSNALFEPGDPADGSGHLPGTVNNVIRPCSISDMFPGKAMTILYYPSRVGETDLNKQYKEGDNDDYLVRSKDYVVSDPPDTTLEWCNMDPKKDPLYPPGGFTDYIRDYRLPLTQIKPYNDGGFILMAASAKRQYACPDSLHNWSN